LKTPLEVSDMLPETLLLIYHVSSCDNVFGNGARISDSDTVGPCGLDGHQTVRGQRSSTTGHWSTRQSNTSRSRHIPRSV